MMDQRNIFLEPTDLKPTLSYILVETYLYITIRYIIYNLVSSLNKSTTTDDDDNAKDSRLGGV